MEENGYWGTKTYHSGRIGEKVKFFVPYARGQRTERSSPEKTASNANNVTRTVARYINDNFRHGDGWLSPSYDGERYERVLARARRRMKMDPSLSERDAIWFSAQHEGELLMDRVRREAKKRGLELRYLLTTSDVDSKTGELVRIHHHLIVCRECVEIVKEKWGSAEFMDPERPEYKDRLWDMTDYTPLAEYMMGQVRHIPNAKRYTPSRNLIKRKPKTRRVVSGARIRPPKGCELLYADPYTGKHDCQYIRYLLPPEKWTGVWAGKSREDVEPSGDYEIDQGGDGHSQVQGTTERG